MRCSSCDRLIPDGSKICQYCGETFTANYHWGSDGKHLGNDVRRVDFAELSRKRFLGKISNILAPIAGFVICMLFILALGGVSFLFDSIQASKKPVQFSQDVPNGDPVWCVVVSVEKPEYVVVETYNNVRNYGYVTPDDESDVLCECLGENGKTVWMLIKYKEYIAYFNGRELSDGIKILGRVKDSKDIDDWGAGEINGEKVFSFQSIEN